MNISIRTFANTFRHRRSRAATRCTGAKGAVPVTGERLRGDRAAPCRLLNRLSYGKGWEAQQLAGLASLNGNPAPEAAVLRTKDNQVNVLIKDTQTARKVSSLGFDANYPPIKMAIVSDLNGNGSEEIVILGRRFNGGNQKAWVKDGKTNASLSQVFFNKYFIGQDMDVGPDINGNGAQELVMLGRRGSDGKLRAFIKDARTGELIGRINF